MKVDFSFGSAAAALRGDLAPTPTTAPPGGKIENGAIFLKEDVLDWNPFPNRSGKTQEEYDKLESSILAIGQKVAILVRPHPDCPGRYQVCYGRTRTEVIRANELVWVKAEIADLSDQQMIEIAFAENHDRNQLNQLDEVDGLLSIMEVAGVPRADVPAIAISLERKGATTAESQVVAGVLQNHSVGLAKFRKSLQILNKPVDVLEAIRTGLPFTIGLLISRVPDIDDRTDLIARAKAGDLTAKGIQEWINARKPPTQPTAATTVAKRATQIARSAATAPPEQLAQISQLLDQIDALLQ